MTFMTLADRIKITQAPFENPPYIDGISYYNTHSGRYTINQPSNGMTANQIVGLSPKMRAVFYLLNLYAPSSNPVLIVGDTGTGKELAAKALHYNGPRHKPKIDNYVVLNAAAIPEGLIESELFGYVKGAFTGANFAGRQGAFMRATDGTIVFDEIADMPLTLQPRLLRVIEEKRIIKLGSDGYQDLGDIRVIASTNKDLATLVQQGKFRADLFHRLAGFELYLPSVKERGADDILYLTAFFLGMAPDEFQSSMPSKILDTLLRTNFTGNVRMIKFLAERAIAFGGGTATQESIEHAVAYAAVNETADDLNVSLPTLNLGKLELLAVCEALTQTSGVQNVAAELLGISPRVMGYKLKALAPKLKGIPINRVGGDKIMVRG